MYRILILAIVVGQIFSSEQIFIKDSELPNICESICDNIGRGNLDQVTSIFRKYWHMDSTAKKAIAGFTDALDKQKIQVQEIFGSPVVGCNLIGYKRVGELYSVYYFQNYTGIPLPIKTMFVKKNNGFLICGIQTGLGFMNEINDFAENVPGQLPKE